MSDLLFGECPYCDVPIERPFWDTCCFNCQNEIREQDNALCECGHPFIDSHRTPGTEGDS